jgi:phenylpyruvate tautomerase PptA (4-oxalocrotonate tautomerase family)
MKNLVFCVCVLTMVSCKPYQKIVYNTDKLKTLEVNRVNNISLSVQTFEDIRSQSDDNTFHLTATQWKAKINGEQSCINSDVLYKTPATEQITDIFAQHLAKKMPQIRVFTNQKEQADYYLEAKVKHFYGIQKFSTSAAVGAQFGLIGALATASAKTNGTIIIELTDIKVFDRQNNLITSVGDLRKEYEGEFPADANCYCIYQNINQKLSEFNDELIGLLSLEIQNRE